MPARDIYHNNVKNALVKDGWTITHDPLHLKWGAKDMYVDLGAEQLLGAEKEGCKIGVEIKSFTGHSEMEELEKAIGQYVLYHVSPFSFGKPRLALQVFTCLRPHPKTLCSGENRAGQKVISCRA